MSKELKDKISLTEMFKQYAKQELEFIAQADPEKVYHRVMPNIKEKDKGTIDFLYRKIIIGGSIIGDTIYLNKLKITKDGKEQDVEPAMKKIEEIITKGDMHLVNNIK